MKVIDVDTMKLSVLDLTWDDDENYDCLFYHHSVEWNGKVYMLGENYIHVITKDCKKYERIKNQGSISLTFK
jgi:hypothetical protein